jgi:nitroimidazol reductase NimA-like FMN-containing flavoprotein (pyridoxamine 5'-phosphate oxidase superfamily)
MDPITAEEALAVLAAAPVAHLGVIENGEPYVTPMSFVVAGDQILFRTIAGRKLEGIRANPVVSIEASKFDEKGGDWVSVIVRGTAAETEDGETKTRAVGLLLDKYREALGSPLSRGGMQPMNSLPHVVVVQIDEITGMVSGRGWGYRTKPGRL